MWSLKKVFKKIENQILKQNSHPFYNQHEGLDFNLHDRNLQKKLGVYENTKKQEKNQWKFRDGVNLFTTTINVIVL